MCTYVYLHVCVREECQRKPEVLGHVEMELQAVVGAGNQTQVVWKSSETSFLLSCLSTPMVSFYL